MSGYGGVTTGGAWRPAAPEQVVDQLDDSVELPGYRDFEVVARSNGSTVYRARQEGLSRPVAVKVLRVADPAALARFQRELDITVRLGRQHPHIVTVIDTGTTGRGEPCIVMEYYDLGSLHDLLRRHGPLAASEVIAAGTVVADALSFAHRQGVLHRDVKPQNILVLPTSYVIADFGIARRIDAAHTASVEWFSFRHASPQVVDGDPPSIADDIWALGSSLYTVLDGRPPFAGDDEDSDAPLEYMRRVRTGDPRPIRRTDLPPGLTDLIDRCLQRDPADRYPDATSLHDALRALAARELAWAPGTAADAAGAPPAPPALPPYVPVGPPAPPTGQAPPPAPSGGPIPPAFAPPAGPAAPPVSAPPAFGPPAFGPPAFGPPAPPAGSAPSLAGPPEPGVPIARAAEVEWSPVAPAIAPPFFQYPDLTGESPTGPHPSARPEPEPVVPPPPRRGPRRLVIALLIAAIVGGTGGIVGTWAAQLGRDTASDATATGRPTLPVPSGSNLNNSRIAPIITELAVQGRTVTLRWQDVTSGQATFVVFEVVEGRAQLVSSHPAKTTETAIDDVDPGSHCYLVVATVGTDRGFSPTRCT